MTMTRGEFLRVLAVGAGGAITGLGAYGENRGESTRSCTQASIGRRNGNPLERTTFETYLNTPFQILDRDSPTTIEVYLVEVTERRSTADCEQFSILFLGPDQPVLSQGTYAVEHDRLGTLELFLVPMATAQRSTSYEAVFSRVRAGERRS